MLRQLPAEWRIPPGVCPSSKLARKADDSLDGHPIDALPRAGVRVSLNTDDPSVADEATRARLHRELAARAAG